MSSDVAWAVRPNPCYVNRVREFLEQGMVAIGWPGMGDLSGADRAELRRRLAPQPYVKGDSRAIGRQSGELDRFVNQMQIGDLVVVPNGGEIYVAEIASGYIYHPEHERPNDGYSHWRMVRYFNGGAPRRRDDLETELRAALKTQIAVFSVPVAPVRALLKREPPPPPPPPVPEQLRPPVYGAEMLLERIRTARDLPERNMEAIVEDLLTRLGHDPKRLVFQSGRIDLRLDDQSGAALFVFEVKRSLGNKGVRDQARRQAFDYAGKTGARYVVLTDADEYEIYDREAGLSHEAMRVGSFRLTDFRREDVPLIDCLRPREQTL